MNQPDSALAPYRALDLTDERGFLCGKILADLGADVIKIEPPGGDPARRHGPFYRNVPHPERSLYWWAFNTSKRGITLDITSPQGRETFKRLAGTADLVIESFSPGYLDSLGLGYSSLRQINPGLILVSITPYGQTGPYRDFQATDLTLMAMGGQMAVSGDSDRPPVRISVPQAYMHGGANAAAGCLIALHYRERTGLGQHVDVSIQESIVRSMGSELTFGHYAQLLCRRHGPCRPRGAILVRDVWPCREGCITLKVLGGPRIREIRSLVEWMAGEGRAGELNDIDWDNLGTFTSFGHEVEVWHEIIGGFFREHTAGEIMEFALRHHLPIMPNNSLADVWRNEQLAARSFWVTMEQPEIGGSAVYPGAPFLLSQTPSRLRSPAPRIGEHNQDVLAELETAPRRPNPQGEKAASILPQGSPALRPPAADQDTALEGLKIADFTWILTGPLTIRYLTNFGAEVVKVESVTRLDNSRVTIPFKDNIQGVNRAGPFQMFNAGKRSLTLNLNDPRGREVARKLVAWADVVAENFSPGTMDKWGLGYRDLKKIKPDIIMFSASIQGGHGPHHLHPGYGWNLSGLAGFNHLTGWPDRDPVSPHTAYTDWVAPVYGAIAILAAVDYRRRTGKGQHIDLSQFETGVSFLASAMLDYTVNGHSWLRRGNRSHRAAPHNVYPCRGYEQWCAIAVATEAQWSALCQVMGHPQWGADARFATLAGRKENEEELDSLVATWTMNLPAEEVMACLQAAGVPAGLVQTNQDLLERDPHLKSRGFFQFVPHPEMGLALCPREPLTMSQTPAQCQRGPLLGEDTEYVCREVLGISAEEFAQLKAAGVLE